MSSSSTRQFLLGLGAGLVLAVVGLVAASFFVGPAAEGTRGTFGLSVPEPPAHLQAYGTAPARWSVRRVAPDSAGGGAVTTLGELRGRTVVVNLWATWCAPCKAEMPSLQALYDATSRDSVALVVVSTEDDVAAVRAYMMRGGEAFTMPIYHAAGAVPPLFETRALPTTFVVDPQGTVVWRHVGAGDWNAPPVRRFLRRVHRAAAETPARGVKADRAGGSSG